MLVDCSPSHINATHAGFINDDTEWYGVKEKNNKSITEMRVNMVKEYQVDKFYHFVYLNQAGGLDCFTAVKVSNNEYKIEKELLDQYLIQKVYNTAVEDTVTVQTQFLSTHTADKLKELFYSPAVKLYFDNTVNDIRITNTKLVVLDKFPKDKMKTYAITFMYNQRFHVQRY
jgi:hypothetical protein